MPPVSEQLAAPSRPFRPGFVLPSRREWVGLLILLGVAGGLRFYALDHSSLWSDEGNTWALISRSFEHIARDAAADIHPPGYYWLLRLWSLVWGTSAWAMRAFSALCGVLLVFETWRLARRLAPVPSVAQGARSGELARLTAWCAAFLLALNPLQIYYSQEARMYMLLALAGAGLYGAVLAYVERESANRPLWGAGLTFCAWGALGLWIHYSFPILLLGAGLYYLACWFIRYRSNGQRAWLRLARFAVLCAAILLAFAPWLPIAVRQVLTWPQGNVPVMPAEGLRLTLETLLLGPMRSLLTPDPSLSLLWVALSLAGLLPLLGLWAMWRHTAPVRLDRPALAIALWLLLPIAMMFGLGLFTDAFLKFLLTASPAWAIAVAWSVTARPFLPHRVVQGFALLPLAAALGLAVWLLPRYYTSPTVRDNYAGVARYVTAHTALSAAPEDALVLLNAPGQIDVWRYYDPGVPVLALPATRPADRAATEATLTKAMLSESMFSEATGTVRRIFALFWGDNEADPERIVETWLNAHAFPGLESWQGNLRFVDYSLPSGLACHSRPAPLGFHAQESDRIQVQLVEQCTDPAAQPAGPHDNSLLQAAGGQVLLMGLVWEFPASRDGMADDVLAVSLQVMDSRNQVVAQRDAPFPPMEANAAESTRRDNHGIPIPVGTPPGSYRLVLALYHPATGRRLTVDQSDFVDLATVEITRTPAAGALLLDAMHNVRHQAGDVLLIGYDLYRKDFGHLPSTPIEPGDVVQFTFYWQAPSVLPSSWPADMNFELHLGDAVLHAPLAGGSYPTGAWQPDEIVRARFELVYPGGPRRPILHLPGAPLQLAPLP